MSSARAILDAEDTKPMSDLGEAENPKAFLRMPRESNFRFIGPIAKANEHSTGFWGVLDAAEAVAHLEINLRMRNSSYLPITVTHTEPIGPIGEAENPKTVFHRLTKNRLAILIDNVDGNPVNKSIPVTLEHGIVARVDDKRPGIFINDLDLWDTADIDTHFAVNALVDALSQAINLDDRLEGLVEFSDVEGTVRTTQYRLVAPEEVKRYLKDPFRYTFEEADALMMRYAPGVANEAMDPKRFLQTHGRDFKYIRGMAGIGFYAMPISQRAIDFCKATNIPSRWNEKGEMSFQAKYAQQFLAQARDAGITGFEVKDAWSGLKGRILLPGRNEAMDPKRFLQNRGRDFTYSKGTVVKGDYWYVIWFVRPGTDAMRQFIKDVALPVEREEGTGQIRVPMHYMAQFLALAGDAGLTGTRLGVMGHVMPASTPLEDTVESMDPKGVFRKVVAAATPQGPISAKIVQAIRRREAVNTRTLMPLNPKAAFRNLPRDWIAKWDFDVPRYHGRQRIYRYRIIQNATGPEDAERKWREREAKAKWTKEPVLISIQELPPVDVGATEAGPRQEAEDPKRFLRQLPRLTWTCRSFGAGMLWFECDQRPLLAFVLRWADDSYVVAYKRIDKSAFSEEERFQLAHPDVNEAARVAKEKATQFFWRKGWLGGGIGEAQAVVEDEAAKAFLKRKSQEQRSRIFRFLDYHYVDAVDRPQEPAMLHAMHNFQRTHTTPESHIFTVLDMSEGYAFHQMAERVNDHEWRTWHMWKSEKDEPDSQPTVAELAAKIR